MDVKFTSIDQYIASQPKETAIILEKIRKTIQDCIPEATETISYQMPAFKYLGMLVYFAGYKNHIGFYALPSGNNSFQLALSQYKTGKGSVQFPLNKVIPYDLIKKIVIFRAEENRVKMDSKKLK